MPATFTRTTRSLSADRARYGTIWIVVSCLLVAVWAAWGFAAQVAVYAVAESARLEVTGLPHPVTSSVDGLIIASRLELGRKVAKGELLIQLDDSIQQAALVVGQQQLAGLERNLVAAANELDAERAAAKAEIEADQVSIDEIAARIQEASARASYANRRLARIRNLHEKKSSSLEELEEAQMKENAMRSSLRAWEFTLTHRKKGRRLKERDRHSQIQELEHDRTEVEGRVRTQAAVLKGLKRDIELRQIKASVAGSVGQQSDYPAGSFVESGEPLAFILPPSPPRAVAFFPSTAVGRVRAGQTARLRLKGFPWTQYGSLPCTVTDVAGETEGGLLRVEMRVQDDHELMLPIKHGVPASAEIAVERLSPASLVLRSIGKLLRPRSTSEGTE